MQRCQLKRTTVLQMLPLPHKKVVAYMMMLLLSHDVRVRVVRMKFVENSIVVDDASNQLPLLAVVT